MKREQLVIVSTIALIVYVAVLIGMGPIVASLFASRVIPGNSGTVKAVGVGVYWDQACTQNVTSINWGLVEPGSSENVTVYIRNEGNAPATFSMSTSGWNPAEAATYITLRWDYNGQTVSKQAVIAVKFTLSVSSDIVGITDFSHDIIVTATN